MAANAKNNKSNKTEIEEDNHFHLEQVQGDKVLQDKVQGDKIVIGNMTGSYAAIGAGAQLLITQIHKAISEVDELQKGIALAEKRLAESIQRLIGYFIGQMEVTNEGRRNPYKSLLDYKIKDAPYFYGRTAAISTALQKLEQNNLLIIHSLSGSGKTSLIQAGLGSRILSQGHFPLYVRPYQTPPGIAIRRTFLPDYLSQPDLRRFQNKETSLRGFLGRVTHFLGGRQMFIFLDQFEEFFTHLLPEDQLIFKEELQDCLASDLNVSWILAVRKEFFSDMRLFRPLKIFENEYFLPRFNLEEASEIIEKPAAVQDVQYEVGLQERILADLNQDDSGISPAQLQIVCYSLFEELDADQKIITNVQYDLPRGRGKSGAEGILANHVSRVLQRDLNPQQRVVAIKILEALVTSEKRRTIKCENELASEVGIDNDIQLQNVLKVLVDNRVLRIDENPDEEDIYELAHDYLLAEIELDPQTQARKAASELLKREIEAYQRYGSLLSKERYALINRQAAYLNINDAAKDLLQKSRKEIRRQSLIRWTTVFGIALIVAVLLIRYAALPAFMRVQAKNDQFAQLVPVDGLQGVAFEAYEVTNERYIKCVDWGGGCETPGAFNTIRPNPDDNLLWFLDDTWQEAKHKPVVEIDAVNALRFCRWIGHTLPTAKQWAFVAPPRTQWSELDGDTAYFCENAQCDLQNPVGSRLTPQYLNKSGKGIFDLVGSVNEWTRTAIDFQSTPSRCNDLIKLDEVVPLSTLGDNFSLPNYEAGTRFQTAGETIANSDQRFYKYGFRCVFAQTERVESYECPSLD